MSPWAVATLHADYHPVSYSASSIHRTSTIHWFAAVQLLAIKRIGSVRSERSHAHRFTLLFTYTFLTINLERNLARSRTHWPLSDWRRDVETKRTKANRWPWEKGNWQTNLMKRDRDLTARSNWTWTSNNPKPLSLSPYCLALYRTDRESLAYVISSNRLYRHRTLFLSLFQHLTILLFLSFSFSKKLFFELITRYWRSLSKL